MVAARALADVPKQVKVKKSCTETGREVVEETRNCVGVLYEIFRAERDTRAGSPTR